VNHTQVLISVRRLHVHAGSGAAAGFLETVMSRKASLLSLSVSMVKRIEGCWLLRCCKRLSTLPRSKTVMVSYT